MPATIHSTGMFGSLRRLLETSVAIVQNRVELVAVELREEKSRAIGIIIWAAVLIFTSFMALVAIMLTLVFLFREQAVYILGGFSLLYLIGAVTAFLMLKAKTKTPPFSETIVQLKKDRAWLRSGK
ncbi:MAG: phage holin family protein [Verrucomicrobiota bacterium]|nr:phage holin family protein [Verrucomicrobiota bacterium]